MYVLQLLLPDDAGKLELVWHPDLPEDEDLPAEKTGGNVVKTEWVKDEDNTIKRAIETSYSLGYSDDELTIDREVFEGFTPADDKTAVALVDEVRKRPKEVSEEDARHIARNVIASWNNDETMSDYATSRQSELTMGLGKVSEREAKELIGLITESTPAS